MYKLIIYLFTATWLWNPLVAKIIEAPSLEIFEEALKGANESSLVLFDIDETLILPQDAILRPAAKELNQKLVDAVFKNPELNPPGKYPKDYLTSKLISRLDYELVDPKVLLLIESLKEKKIKTMAFTHMKTGPFGVIPSLEEWRLNSLAEKNICFEDIFPNLKYLSFNEMEKNGRWPVYQQGVLFTGNLPKGPVLIAFLKRIQWKPQVVYFLDNDLSYLQSVEESLKNTGIDFLGFHYTATENETIRLNEKVAELQFNYLVKEGEWLNDGKALQELESAQMQSCLLRIKSLKECSFDFGSDTLVVFDVDDVLISAKDACFRPKRLKHLFKVIQQKYDEIPLEEHPALDEKLSLCYLSPERGLIEKDTPQLIANLQKQGIKVIALTHCPTGKYGLISSIESWRINHLKSFGIDFSRSFPSLGRHSFDQLANKRPPPLYDSGVLFSYGYEKGEVLVAFLKHVQWTPKRIIFFDDLVGNHQSVSRSLDGLGINYTGYHYQGTNIDSSEIEPETELDLMQFQLEHLLKHGVWLSDCEAEYLFHYNGSGGCTTKCSSN